MKKFTVRNNIGSREVIMPATSTVIEVFNEAEIELGNGVVNILGKVVTPSEYDKPICDLVGDREEYVIASVVKADCA